MWDDNITEAQMAQLTFLERLYARHTSETRDIDIDIWCDTLTITTFLDGIQYAFKDGVLMEVIGQHDCGYGGCGVVFDVRDAEKADLSRRSLNGMINLLNDRWLDSDDTPITEQEYEKYCENLF